MVDFLTRERGRCALVFERIGGSAEAVDALACQYRDNPDDRLSVRIWSAIAICLEAKYRTVSFETGGGLDPHDAWQLGWVATSRALRFWRPGFQSKGKPVMFLTYAVKCYERALRYEIQERGTVVKIERRTKGYWDRYRAMRSGVVRIDHEPYEKLEALECYSQL